MTAVVAIFAAGVNAFAEDPPEDVILRLTAEAYPERVAAQEKLRLWATKGGENAKRWLLTKGGKSDDPEIGQRSMAVLKSVVIEELTQERPGFVGINMGSVKLIEKEGFGVEILKITPDSPAEKAGLKIHDIVVKFDGRGWTIPQAEDEFAERVGKKRGGDKVVLEILRGGKRQEAELILAPRPWSAGLYSDRLKLRADPFAARGKRLLLTEEEAVEEAFRKWLEGQSTE